MSVASYAGLIQSFGKSIGLADAAPDADGYLAMSFDDLVVHFQFDDDADELTIFSRIGDVDEDRTEGIYGMLLSANLFWQGSKGTTLSVDPDSRLVFVADRRPVAQLNDAAFQSWLGRFIDVAEHWQKRLETANQGGPLWPGDDNGQAPEGPDAGIMTRV
jgi:hypothetical protein